MEDDENKNACGPAGIAISVRKMMDKIMGGNESFYEKI